MTRKRRLGEERAEHVLGGSSNPRRIVLVPVDTAHSGVHAMLSTVDTPDVFINWFVGDGDRLTLFQIAQAAALLTIDQKEQLLFPQFMPTRAAHAILFSDGAWRHSRGRTFAPWVLEEAGRLAAVLLAQHPHYIRGIKAVLANQRVRGFDPLSSAFIFQDPMRTCRMAPPAPALDVDLSKSPTARGAKWWHVVQLDYLRDRYLKGMTRAELSRRAVDVVSNHHVIDNEDRVSLDASDATVWYWQCRLTELMSEAAQRFGRYPNGWKELLADAEWPLSMRQAEWRFKGPLTSPANLKRPFLVKYEDRRFLKPMLRDGEVRISPASRYADPSLNSAIRDEELSAELMPTPLGMTAFGGLPGPVAAAIQDRNRVTKRIGTNYYVYCTSSVLMTRLAHDFGRDAALVIHDPDEFYRRLDIGLRERLSDWRMIATPVEYYDPLNVNEHEVDVLTWKHFRYAYQRETRAAWLPASPRKELPILDLRIGRLDDICEIVLPGTGQVAELRADKPESGGWPQNQTT